MPGTPSQQGRRSQGSGMDGQTPEACQKLQGIQNIPSQRVTDLEAAIRQLRQINCILDSCTISASYEVSQAQKAFCCFRIQPKEQAHHRKSSMHKYRHALTMSIIFHMMKIICRSTRTLIFSAHRNDGAMRHVLVGYLSPLPHSGSDKSAVFSARPIQQAPPELSARNCPRV